ncbi:flagellar hook-basal body complex protein FliE [Salinibacillus xinjiangensis]|uniref:Flagellar hook-basal body complex protein FliE n=1 Tax=Salinibacillus xinjiangensis TaxID=1229268 RepID=A0A6G1X375_9BACI|nr:flagellar hook-basal body complex protein FliE [Salinibacillus xinjiangensis]MRG85404.1 flagellar hook-basal body complex protein FliE [Salinibacillus xinjiangensis]
MPTINQILATSPNPQLSKGDRTSPFEAQQNFSQSLKNAIDKVNDSQIKSDQMTTALAKGEIDNLHDVMISAQKASITLQTAVEVQSKAIEAYKEVMRMQL